MDMLVERQEKEYQENFWTKTDWEKKQRRATYVMDTNDNKVWKEKSKNEN